MKHRDYKQDCLCGVQYIHLFLLVVDSHYYRKDLLATGQFFVGAAGDGPAHETRRSYKWHSRAAGGMSRPYKWVDL